MFWSPITTSQDPFKYRALEAKTTIRLIKVCRTKINDHIACRISHFDETQQKRAKYHALSYVWGDQTKTQDVYLRDQGNIWHLVTLHENLWRFLDYTWRHKHFKRRFWTDRLCLDQDNTKEISQQVPRMHTIYSNAALVVVWLQSQEQQQKHRGLIKVARWSHILKPMPKLWCRIFRDELSRLSPEGNDNVWAQMMRNDYWQRAWIVQEVVAAKKVYVTFEDVSIDFDKLPALFLPVGWPIGPRLCIGNPAQERAFWALFEMRAGDGKLPLWGILRNLREYKSSRPADRVYGLLGMAANHDDGSLPVDNIKVDYDKPIMHVFLDAAFESSPPLKWFASGFLPRDLREGFGTDSNLSRLQSYIASSRTTQRHRKLARRALETLDAFEIIGLIMDNALESMTVGLLCSAATKRLKPTSAQSAALIGIGLVQGYKVGVNASKARCDAAKTRRHLRSMASSPWRCNAHRSHNGGHTGLGSNEVVVGRVDYEWKSKDVAKACGERSQSCDGSSLTFEIPQIGFRVLLGTAIGPSDTGNASLHLVGREDPTIE